VAHTQAVPLMLAAVVVAAAKRTWGVCIGNQDHDLPRVVGPEMRMVRRLRLRDHLDFWAPGTRTVCWLLLRERLDSPPSDIIIILSDLPPSCVNELAPVITIEQRLRLRPRLRPRHGDSSS
jgi:hypothetical protein